MGLSQFNHVKISGVKVVFPDKCIHIDEEIHFYKDNPKILERNKKILGLGTRYITDKGVTSLDLCEQATKELMIEMHTNIQSVDTIIYASSSHEYSTPADACILHGRLNLSESCACFDMGGLSCSAYVHALWLAHSLIASGASKKCLILASDMNSTHSDVRNRISNMLYSDAGSATLLEYTDDENTAFFYTGTRGKDWDKIIIPASGAKLPIRKDIAELEISDKDGNIWHLYDEILKGMDIFKFTMENAPHSVNKILEYAHLTINDIDFVAFHQANGQIVKTVATHSGVPKDKYTNETFSKYANCGAPSVLSNICDALNNKNINKLMLVTFGVGLSWGTSIVNFKETYNGGISFYKPTKTMNRQEQIGYWIKYFKGE